ncbi:MAG: glycosyltransferase [Alphaproteobacteria bacterium]|nr:glycosyltransferase [Alphaproteobacteria bacterium]
MTPGLRIALLLHGLPPEQLGGTGLYVAALARALAAAGHEVAVLAPRPGAARVAVVAAGPGQWAIELPTPTRIEAAWDHPGAAAALCDWLHRWRADVVHAHHLAHGGLGFPRAARDASARVVLTLHDYALPCARGQLVDAALRPCPGPEPGRCATCLAPQLRLSPLTAPLGAALERWPALRARARDGVAATVSSHAASDRDRARLADRLERVRRLLAEVDVLLSPSHDLAERFAAMGLRRPEVLSLPLVQPISPAPPPGAGPLRLLFASSVIPTKGPDRLLAAFARLPAGRATLTIAGPAPAFDGRPGWGEALRARVEATPGARWLGAVPPGEVPLLLADHDVLVLPSTWPENSPLVVREALAAGLRVVLPAVGGATELDPTAPAVGPDDDEALLAALHAELKRGRGRVPPARWPTPADHAATLVDTVYRRPLGNDRSHRA